MDKMKKLIIIPILFFSLILSATNHYVATKGSGTGTIGNPFNTLTQVNTHVYVAGDSILFNRGDTFYGTLSIAQSGSISKPIIIGAYGIGVNPIISEFTSVSVWTNLGGNIWESTNAVSTLSTCNMVTINGVNTPMGRYPNSGYFTFQSHSGTTSITTNRLNGTTNWTGAELVIRTKQFVLDRNVITGQSISTLTYGPVVSMLELTNGYGFFIQNDVRTLDSINEWYYNPSTKKIRIYSTNEPVNVKVSSVNFTCELWKNYLTFQNITFEGANNYNFDSSWSGGNTNITIRNCNILNAGIDAIRLTSLANLLIEDNIIMDSNNNGINLQWNDLNAIIRNNTIVNSGIYAGMGQNGMRQYSGIAPGYRNTCDGMVIEYNNVINSGYIGIAFEGDLVLVKNNFVDTYCTVLEDGGGIYTNNEGSINSRSIITGNIVLNGIGAINGTDHLWESNVNGIYLDNESDDIEVCLNTVSKSFNYGLFVHDADNFNIHNNTFLDNGIHLSISDTIKKGSIQDNKFILK